MPQGNQQVRVARPLEIGLTDRFSRPGLGLLIVALKQMRVCSEKLRGMVPPQTMAMLNQFGKQQSRAEEKNICSGFN